MLFNGPIQQLDRGLARVERWLLIATAAAMTIIMMTQVVMRYFFSAPIFWAEEISVQLLVLMTLFGLSLLVPDGVYAQVAQWVDQTHLKGRLVYFRVRLEVRAQAPSLHADSLVRKLVVKPDSPFYAWLDRELSHRFDVACCATQEQFRREVRAITRAGQIKSGGERHEKDDRHRLDDRSRYVLGWSNTAKLAALEAKRKVAEAQLAPQEEDSLSEALFFDQDAMDAERESQQ